MHGSVREKGRSRVGARIEEIKQEGNREEDTVKSIWYVLPT
jgi:hypothetical protein